MVPGPGLPDGRHRDPGPRRPARGLPHGARLDSCCAARSHIEEVRKDREAIIVTEVPVPGQTHARHDGAHRRSAVNDKIIEGISELARRIRPRRRARGDRAQARREPRDRASTSSTSTPPLQTTRSRYNMLALDQRQARADDLEANCHPPASWSSARKSSRGARDYVAARGAQARTHVLIGLAVSVVNLDRRHRHSSARRQGPGRGARAR